MPLLRHVGSQKNVSDTEQLFVVAAVWALVAAAIARFIPNWPGRIAFFVFAVGIPFWELPYGYYNYHLLCREGLKLQVFEKITPQEVVCADYPYVTIHNDLLKFGFTTVETRGKAGEIKRFTVKPGESVAATNQQGLTSNYCLTFVNNNRLPWRVWRHDQLIARANDRHIVARQSRYSWAGMWWQEEMRPVFGRGGECSDEMNRTIATLRDGAS